MTDRKIVYNGAIPQDSDILSPERNLMTALGWLLQAVMGTSTGVAGLACAPTIPASMVVNVGQGAIWSQEEIDANAFGSLGADTSPLMKLGINPEAAGTNFTLTAPTTSGNSINYLIEATFEETDNTPLVLPYVNPANPQQPFAGPNNTNVSQNTVRQQLVQLQLKAGAQAPTGTQVTPAVDSGWVGLYVITVNFGQTTVIAANISVYPNAPFLPLTLPQIQPYIFAQTSTRLTSNFTLFVSTTGSDSNNGLTSATAFATIQHAWNVLVGNYNLNGFNAVIQVADGTYNQSTVLYGSINGLGPTTGGSTHNTVTIQGNVTTPTNCVINGTSAGDIFVAGGGSFVTIDGFKLQTTFPGNCILANAGAIVVTGNLNFGSITTSASCHMTASNSACIFIGKSYAISGSAASHIDVSSGASLQKNSSAATVVTLTGTPNFPVGFVDTASCSSVTLSSANHTFSGAATGLRYTVNANSVINTSGSGASYFPGSVTGTTSTGGQYI